MSDETCPKCGAERDQSKNRMDAAFDYTSFACGRVELQDGSTWFASLTCADNQIATLTAETERLKDKNEALGYELANIGEQLACDEPWKSFNRAIGEFVLTPEEAGKKYRRLQAIVGKLPKDADGVPVVVGVDDVYHHDSLFPCNTEVGPDGDWLARESDGQFRLWQICDCYYYRDAAEAAQEQE